MTPFSMFDQRVPPLDANGMLSQPFFRFLRNLFLSAGGGGPTSVITVGLSPFSFTASQVGEVIVKGGSVSKIEFSRDGTNVLDTGVTAGMFPIKNQDVLRVTYAAAPTMTFVPS